MVPSAASNPFTGVATAETRTTHYPGSWKDDAMAGLLAGGSSPRYTFPGRIPVALRIGTRRLQLRGQPRLERAVLFRVPFEALSGTIAA